MFRLFKFLAKLVVAVLVLLAIGIGAAFTFGPRTVVDTKITFDPAAIGQDASAYLAREEAKIADIRPGLQKQIIWADPATKAKTPLAILYIHGFSASLGEVRPLPDLVAKNLGANLFYTRLDGHGRAFDAMGAITVNHWLNDIAEAIAIGQMIGKKVVVISTSTGGSIVTWALNEPSLKDKITASVFISPNYGVQADGAFLLTMPFAKEMAHQIVGPRRSFVPENAIHKAYSSYDYPVEALLPMAEMVKLANAVPVQSIKIPALFLISPKDPVVVPELTRDVAKRWGGAAKLVEVGDTGDAHVLAGDGLSPARTRPLADDISAWISTTVK